MLARTLSRQSYTVGIIYALDMEKAVVEQCWMKRTARWRRRWEKAVGDDNAYIHL
jgi:hypothetical protein